MRALLCVLLTFCCAQLQAQVLRVIAAKRAFLQSGLSLNQGDTISIQNRVNIAKKGSVVFGFRQRWSFRLTQGSYDLDSCFRANKEAQKTQDSIAAILEGKGLIGCKFPYTIVCNGPNKPHSYGNDIKSDKSRTTAAGDTVELEWNKPDGYAGKYYVLIKSVFQEYLSLSVTTDTRVTLNLKKVKDHKHVLVQIVSEECRESRDFVIEMK